MRPTVGDRVAPRLPVPYVLAVGILLASVAATPISLARFTNGATSTGTFSTATLQPPTGVSATSGASIVLAWTASTSSSATGYILERATALGGPYAQIATVTPVSVTGTVDNPEAECAATAIKAAEQQHRGGLGLGRNRTFGDARGTLLHLDLDSTDLSKARGIEQQDRTSVIGQSGAGIEARVVLVHDPVLRELVVIAGEGRAVRPHQAGAELPGHGHRVAAITVPTIETPPQNTSRASNLTLRR